MAKKRPQNISFGDLVSVQGYEGRLYFVDSWSVEHHYTPDETWTEVLYDITDAHTGEYMMAEKEDVTRVCGAAEADEYLKNPASPQPEETTKRPNVFDQIFGEVPKMKSNEPRNPSARELSGIEAERRKQARKERAVKIDALLDEYNDARAMVEMFGDEEYRAKAEYLRLKMVEIVDE